jgi:hypothetical protein
MLGLMENVAVLCPQVLGAKDLIQTTMDLEKFLKDNPEVSGEDQTPLDLTREFLNGLHPEGEAEPSEDQGEDESGPIQ